MSEFTVTRVLAHYAYLSGRTVYKGCTQTAVRAALATKGAVKFVNKASGFPSSAVRHIVTKSK
ncbi:MAG: hypothetical protein GY938_26950 [Ketobacter sp.]|nr:hypothetical protein [Ketobacter sp.]